MNFSLEDVSKESAKRSSNCTWLYERGTTCPDKDEEGLWFARYMSAIQKLKSITNVYAQFLEELKNRIQNEKAPQEQAEGEF